nr:MAG TPA: Terminase large subunit [Caudoviricetes sp.]
MSINTKQYIEKYIKIRDKSGKIINLQFNEPQQRLYDIIKEQKLKNKPVRIVILKARQLGFSTIAESILFKETTTKFNVNTGIITHQDEATKNLFNMSKLMYECLPQEMKPAKKASNAQELIFDNDKGTGLKSKIRCMTAGSQGVGRSYTYDNLHVSELAFWPGNKKTTMTGLLQAVPNLPSTIIIIESTANGFEYFKEIWDGAVAGENDFIPLFVGWNELKDYQMPYTGFELTSEEIQLQRDYNLSLEQLTWRRWCIRNNCSNDIEQFKQEYPITPEEAFISTGACYFNKEIIMGRINKIKNIKPLRKGYFSYSINGNKISDIEFIDDDKGYIDIYEEPKEGHPYVLGGDTAGDGSDYFTGLVIDNSNSKQIAKLRHNKIDEDEYSRQIYCLGTYYNNALVGLENNYSTYPTKKLKEYDYPKMYIREVEDNIPEVIQDKYGFLTTKATRPIILAMLKEIFRDNISYINDLDVLYEGLVFIKNEKGRAEAEQGKHDDLIMGLAITYYIRTQQSFIVKKIEKEEKIELPFALQTDDEESDDIIGW